MISGDSDQPLVGDFKWADNSPIVRLPTQPTPLTIEATAEPDDAGAQAPSVSWAARTKEEA
jgi:hypothetical protein